MKKILIIEDEPTQQQVYKLKLGKKYELTFANSEATAFACVDPSPQLILLDIMLVGGKNGFDILQELKNNPQTRAVPVIMLTNLSESERDTALALGAVEYVTKTSIGPEKIVTLVEKYIL